MSGFFSKTECEGGCGNLLPQSEVDRGRRYLWGHKGGCPKEGESARRTKATRAEKPKPGPVTVHVSYGTSLAMVTENFRAARLHLTACVDREEKASAELAAAMKAVRDATAVAGRLRTLGSLLASYAESGVGAWGEELEAFLALVRRTDEGKDPVQQLTHALVAAVQE